MPCVSFSEISANLAFCDISHRLRFTALLSLRLGDAVVADEHQERAQTQKPARKKLIRRDDRDHSQPLRVTVQILFAILNVWIGVQFYLWVRWAEGGGRLFEVSRPAGVEGWLPIEGLMQLKYFLITGKVPHVHAAGFFLFTSFLVISFVFRKAFCSWMCPVGTVSEYLWKLGRSMFGRSFQLPRWADIPLRSLKYLVLSFFAYAVIGMSTASIADFLNSPYALIVDVRMLNFFRYIGGTAAWVVLGLLIASIFVQNFWCRYLCPYGGFLGLVSLFSPVRITRNASTCIDCAKCAKACPSALPVDKLLQIRSAECTGCLECVAVCPAKETLIMSGPVVCESAEQSQHGAWSRELRFCFLAWSATQRSQASGTRICRSRSI